ncbi:Virulence protein STM3117 [Morganella morganii]|nr:Virulence protein STM3117 [Morganella morganii]
MLKKPVIFTVAYWGFRSLRFAGIAGLLVFGRQKINLHQAGNEFLPNADKPVPGSADLCFLTGTPVEQTLAHLAKEKIVVEEGPVERTGGNRPDNISLFP